MKNKRHILTIFLFILICGVSIALRTWKIQEPIADWHSFRQVDTASVARIYTEKGIDLLRPRYHDLSNIQSGKDNPEGWRMVEFPLYQGIAAFVHSLYPRAPIEIYLRLLTIVSSTLTGLLLGILVTRRTRRLTGIMTFFVYAILPFSIFYGRVVLPDPFMVFLSILTLFILDTKDKEVSWVKTILAGIVGALAILVKPQAAFLLLPALILFFHDKISISRIIKFIVWGGMLLIPFMLWRNWIMQFPEGIPAFDWLLNKDNIRFKGAWFFWLFADRVGRLILGYWGLILFGVGLISISKREGLFFRLLLLGSLLYLVIIAGGNVQHDYYQILLIPVLAIYTGKGISYLWDKKEGDVSVIGSKILVLVSLVFMFMFSWYTIRTYYWYRMDIVEAGRVTDALIPKNAKVITAFGGDTTFLYQTKRIGWPQNFEIDKKISMGATHYLTVSSLETDMEAKELSEKYSVIKHTDTYTLIDLTKLK